MHTCLFLCYLHEQLRFLQLEFFSFKGEHRPKWGTDAVEEGEAIKTTVA